MPAGCTSLLVEHFAWLTAAATPGLRLPALETLMARGTVLEPLARDADLIRGALFGLDPGMDMPVGALTRSSDRNSLEQGEHDVHALDYCLRVDPVTLRADLGRVVMTSSGFAGFELEEQQELDHCVRSVLRLEGLELSANHAEHWTLPLPAALPFSFVPLQEALGVNLADVMPAVEEARTWRRIHNEIQVALYACEVNAQRRLAGKREINAVWFWGGGYAPAIPTPCPFELVYTSHPVSRGLALLAGCAVADAGPETILANTETRATVLIDWIPKPAAAVSELMQLEQLLQKLMSATRQSITGQRRGMLRLYSGTGMAWEYTRHSAWRFWRRPRALGTTWPAADLAP